MSKRIEWGRHYTNYSIDVSGNEEYVYLHMYCGLSSIHFTIPGRQAEDLLEEIKRVLEVSRQPEEA